MTGFNGRPILNKASKNDRLSRRSNVFIKLLLVYVFHHRKGRNVSFEDIQVRHKAGYKACLPPVKEEGLFTIHLFGKFSLARRHPGAGVRADIFSVDIAVLTHEFDNLSIFLRLTKTDWELKMGF